MVPFSLCFSSVSLTVPLWTPVRKGTYDEVVQRGASLWSSGRGDLKIPMPGPWVWSMVSHMLSWASLVAQSVKNLPAMQETWVRSLGQNDSLQKETATHSSILAWRIPWIEEPGGLQSMGFQKWDTTYWLNHHHGTESGGTIKYWIIRH